MSNILISCGGTGGHLVPGIAIGEALIKNGHNVSFIISEKEIDSRLVKKYSQFNFIKSPGAPLSVKGIFKFLSTQRKAYLLSKKLIKDEKADAAIAFGGFNSFGLSMASFVAKKPLILHEANRKPGKAIKFFGKIARRVYVPYGVKIDSNKRGLVKHAGYPIRSEIKELDKDLSKQKLGFSKDAKIILICGGSQGAAALNKWASDNFETLAQEGFDMLCITGPKKNSLPERSKIDKNGVERFFKVIEFCDDMASAMSASEIAIARAGAGTIAEFARCKLIPILVPYPFSADQHQMENAQFIEKSGAGICLNQNKIENATNEILTILKNPELQEKMKQNLAKIDDTNDVKRIVDDVENLIRESEK